MRDAFRLSKQPTAEMYFELASILEGRSSSAEAASNYRRALEASKTLGDVDLIARSLSGLARSAFDLGKQEESDRWFNAFVETGKACAWDWRQNADRRKKANEYLEAGKSYIQAATSAGGYWKDWCDAAKALMITPNEEDTAISCARRCLSDGSGKKDSEQELAYAHLAIADVLNTRGVFQEALSHASEASVLVPSFSWAYDTQARALLGLRRFQEAINASNQAIRLSDGKYANMHFNLGSAYYGVENWQFARQSFERVAQLDTKDTAAPYNVALCYRRLGFYYDAAKWYEEVLRRNPNHPEKQDILNQIQKLRR
jgi:tetratricopeptide (TPR) repeat protein